MGPGRGTYAFFLDAQGRIRSDSHVFVEGDRVLIDCEPHARATLQEHIESYIVMDDVTLEDRSTDSCLVEVLGPAARAVVSGLCAHPPESPLSFARTGGLRVFRVPLGPTDGYWVEGRRSDAAGIAAELEARGAVAASEPQREGLRVERGVPRFGADFGPANIPHETQQLGAVSFAKGCYTGQEIVERVRSQGRVRRALVGLELETETLPEDLTVTHEGTPVGTMTSPTPGSLAGGRARGFAVVRRQAAAPGSPVRVGGSPAVTVGVATP